jgi:hypothetical protein
VIQKYDRGKFIAFLYLFSLCVRARSLACAESQAFVFEAVGYLLLSAGARGSLLNDAIRKTQFKNWFLLVTRPFCNSLRRQMVFR